LKKDKLRRCPLSAYLALQEVNSLPHDPCKFHFHQRVGIFPCCVRHSHHVVHNYHQTTEKHNAKWVPSCIVKIHQRIFNDRPSVIGVRHRTHPPYTKSGCLGNRCCYPSYRIQIQARGQHGSADDPKQGGPFAHSPVCFPFYAL